MNDDNIAMKSQGDLLKRYIQETLGMSVHPDRWAGQDRLPLFLQDRYRFYEVRVLGTACVLMIDLGDEGQSPATVHKHMAKVQAQTDGVVIYVRDRVTAYNRKRLIEHKVPFVVPGNQMYLPMLGIDLREHFKRLRSESPEFSPSAQAVLIYWLLSGKEEAMTPSLMAERLGYSPMTMTRAFDELESTQLGECTKRGRERCVTFSLQRRELWSRAQSFLRSPVRMRRHIGVLKTPSLGVRAGLTALAHYSMLAEPDRSVFAVGDKDWKTIRHRYDGHVVPAQEPEACEIEIWGYDPTLFAENGLADRLSLYLSLRDNRDERVEAALEEMMEGLGW